MQVQVRGGAVERAAAEALILGIFEAATRPAGAWAAVNQATDRAITETLKRGDFTGKASQLTVLYPTSGRAKRLILVGLGDVKDLTADRIRQAMGRAITHARFLGLKDVMTVVPKASGKGGMDPRDAAQALVEGAILGNYTFSAYHTVDKDRKKQVRSLSL